MAVPWLRIIADDLTGACDVGAALLPHPRILVESTTADRRMIHTEDAALVVRNTQSRTLAPAAAVARVRGALRDVPAGTAGVLFKKIDSALRGALGAELDAAMDAVGAATALVLPAIPEAGRTTVDGRQLADGIPVHETAFARDPENPVRDASVVRAVEATGRRRAVAVSRDVMRRMGTAGVLDHARRHGATVVVGDAETDDDLARWIGGLADAPVAPRVLVGSTGLARAWRATWTVDVADAGSPPAYRAGRRGVLVVSGSAHPVTRAQLDHLGVACGARRWPMAWFEASDSSAAVRAALDADGVCCIVPPDDPDPRGGGAVASAIASIASRMLPDLEPAALVLVGGETAHRVLAELDHPRLRIVSSPAPLVVRTVVDGGPLAGMPIVTMGGSSGPVDRLTRLVREVLDG